MLLHREFLTLDTSLQATHRLQAAIMEDLLGPQWTRRQRRTPRHKGDSIIVRPQEILVPPETLQHIPARIQDAPEIDRLIREIRREIQLSPQEAAVLALYLDGFKYREIAQHLPTKSGTAKIGTVKSSMARIKRKGRQ